MVIPITRNSMLLFGVLSLLISVFGFYSYFGSTKYDLVTLEGTLTTSGESIINGRAGKEGDKVFEFYIKEKPQIRFRINSLAYYFFKKDLRDSLGVNNKKVIFDVDKNEIDNPRVGSDSVKNVSVYTFRDEKYTYLDLEDTKKSDLQNRKYGLYVAIAFLIGASILFWIRTTLQK
jgi:cell division septal protein FtsQ